MEESKRLELLRAMPYLVDEHAHSKRLFKWKLDLNAIVQGSFEEKLAQAGINVPKEVYFGAVLIIAMLCGYLGALVGKFLALFSAALVAYYLITCLPLELSQRRRRKMVPQLPSFLDALIASLSTGYSIDAALLQGAQAMTKGVLHDEFEHAVNLLKSGMSIDESFKRLRQRVTGREVISIVTAIDLFTSMGGRMLDPFERLGKKIREQERALERAYRDLVQIKQAFIIIGGLSIVAPVAVYLMQPGYMESAFDDPFGAVLMQVSIMIELTCIFVFRRMTNLKV